ncbi:MAG: SpoIVB peptidase, partial [Clostridia bacterium]|nr:SpoIVB peptidase [Clostridia bacterium]
KILKKSIVVLPVLLFLTVYQGIPQKVTIVEGERLDLSFGVTATVNTAKADRYLVDAKLFNLIPIKSVDVSVVPKKYLIPSGEAIGVKLYTDGVLVVGISDVADALGNIYQPAKDAGIMVGDRILSVNGESVKNIDDFTDKINESGKKATLEIAREDHKFTVELLPAYSKDSGSYKVGLWVRDSTAGIGTLTFYNPENNTFGALGHGICDSDTKELMTVRCGSVNACTIRNVIKGERGIAGELTGDFSGIEIGDITQNTHAGISGNVGLIPEGEPVMIASRFEVKKGNAEILCDVDGAGPKRYKIEITKIQKGGEGKNLVLRVTDERLLGKTGGIVQGMSGSPVLQNGKIVGAVTHVFVNDPTKGYGIFIENML